MNNEIPKQEINQEETAYDLLPDIDWIALDDMDEEAIKDFRNKAINFLSTEDISTPEKFNEKLMRLRKALRRTSEANNEFYITDILAEMYSKLKWSEDMNIEKINKNPLRDFIDKKSHLDIKRIRTNEVFVISGKTPEELTDLAIKIFLKIENIHNPKIVEREAKQCREELSSKETLRPSGYAIYLRRNKLYIDSRNHRNDNEMKTRLENIVMEVTV